HWRCWRAAGGGHGVQRRPQELPLLVPRAGDRAGVHRPARDLPYQPGGTSFLRAEPDPGGTGAREPRVHLLRFRHDLLQPGHDAHALRHGPGALPLDRAPLLLPAPRLALRGPGGAARHLCRLPALLLAAAAGLRAVRPVLPRDLVLHPARADRLPAAVRHPAAASHRRGARLQLQCHSQPHPHAPPKSEKPLRTFLGQWPGSGRGGPGARRRGERVSMAEETDHLILLAIMTITFAVCSLPFTIFAYMNETSSRKEKWDLQALRFLSINSIIDPWVFAILRPPVLRLMRSVLCCRISLRTQDTIQTSCSTQSDASKQADP
uniref:Prostaglandin E2 receptor EP2 subtype n=1 Tax=Macaca fascicularis TaxID=9541 RepID=A0A2K5U7U9_MACFA